MDGNIVNIAGYRFVDLPDRDDLRQPFRDICSRLNLKGTILLAHEGINFFLAGVAESIDSYIDYIEQDSRFRDITLKKSVTNYQPFNRMNVRLKKEIISIGLDHIKPAEFTGQEITPTDFKQLLLYITLGMLLTIMILEGIIWLMFVMLKLESGIEHLMIICHVRLSQCLIVGIYFC